MRNNKRKKNNISSSLHYSDESLRAFALESGMTPYIGFLKEIIENENFKNRGCPFTKETAVVLDEFEKAKASEEHRQQHPTVDCVVGLEHGKLLMVEMKSNAVSRSMKNIARNVKSKRQYSYKILRCSPNYGCENKIVVLLSDKNFEIQKSQLYRTMNNDTYYEILKISEFYNRYFNSKQQPKVV